MEKIPIAVASCARERRRPLRRDSDRMPTISRGQKCRPVNYHARPATPYFIRLNIYIYIHTRHFLDYCARSALNVPYGARYRTNCDGFIGWTGCFLDRMFDGFREKCIFFSLPLPFF